MKWTPATVDSKRVWSDGLFTLGVRAKEVEAFKPGQFLQLGFAEENGHLNRPYSVASPHGEVLEFFIVVVPDGKLTPRLWSLNPGDVLNISQRATGSFTLDHCPEGDSLWLIGTGTGLAPYVAMLRTPEPWNRYERVVVVHGVRHARDLAYREEFARHKAKTDGKFVYVPVISREEVANSIPGRITTAIENGALEDYVGTPLTSNSAIMLCGNPEMLDDCESLLADRGITKHKKNAPGQIVIERYW